MGYTLFGILLIIIYELLFRKATHKLLFRLHSFVLIIGAYIANYWRKILRAFIQLAIDFTLFWFVFLWRDGQIATGIGGGLSQFGNWCATAAGDIGSFFVGLWEWFVRLLPADIGTADGLSFLISFLICLVLSIVGFVSMLIFADDMDEEDAGKFWQVTLSLAATSLYIFACYWACHLFMRILFNPVWLSRILMILVTLIAGVIILIVCGLIFYGLLKRCGVIKSKLSKV